MSGREYPETLPEKAQLHEFRSYYVSSWSPNLPLHGSVHILFIKRYEVETLRVFDLRQGFVYTEAYVQRNQVYGRKEKPEP